MKLLGQHNTTKGNHYLFAPRKKEDTDKAIDRISELIQGPFSYIGLTSEDDIRKNGYADLVKEIEIDWNTHNLIIVTKE